MSTPPGYTYIDMPRTTGKEAGLAVIYRAALSVTQITVPCVSSFECIAFKMNVAGASPVLVLFIYRPPKPNPLGVFFLNTQNYLHLLVLSVLQ